MKKLNKMWLFNERKKLRKQLEKAEAKQKKYKAKYKNAMIDTEVLIIKLQKTSQWYCETEEVIKEMIKEIQKTTKEIQEEYGITNEE